MMTLIEFIVNGTSAEWKDREVVAMVNRVSSVDFDKVGGKVKLKSM